MSNIISDNQVRLGCGTLIAIALIVWVFSGGGDSGQVASEVRSLKEEVRRLETKIDALIALQENCSPAASLEHAKTVESEPPAADMPN